MLEIYFKDLTPEAQKDVLKFYSFKSELDGNWDVIPLFVLERGY